MVLPLGMPQLPLSPAETLVGSVRLVDPFLVDFEASQGALGLRTSEVSET